MIIVTCALKCEAKPLIDAFRLKHQKDSELVSYRSEKLIVFITGVDSLKAASAMQSILKDEKLAGELSAVVNIGICGAADPALQGELFFVKKVLNNQNTLLFELNEDFEHGLPAATVESFIKPVSSCRELSNINNLADMELATVVESVRRAAPALPVYALKVVSDPLSSSKIPKELVSRLIYNKIGLIKSFLVSVHVVG